MSYVLSALHEIDRIDFKSAGAQRGEFKPRTKAPASPAAELSPEEHAARKAKMKADWDALIAKYDQKQKKSSKPAHDPSVGRIGFSSLGTKK